MATELRHLRALVAVADDLSFSIAARRLFISQQALSRIIQQLERQVGARVFERTTRSVQLTAAGEVMLSDARRAVAAADQAVEAARRVARRNEVRPIRLDLSSTGLQTGARILQRVRLDHPDLPVELVEDGVPRGLEALRNGRLDILLGLATHCPPELNASPVRREPVLVGMRAGHPLVELDAVPVARLADVDLLLPSEAAAIEWVQQVNLFCAEAGVQPRRWPVATHGSAAAAEVLRGSDCLTPTVAWADPPADLAFRPLVEPMPVFTWSMMTAPPAEERPELRAVQRSVLSLGAEENWTVPAF